MRDRSQEAVERLASHSTGIFWFVLPTLPLFLVFPVLLRRGFGFWPGMALVCAGTALLYALTAKLLVK